MLDGGRDTIKAFVGLLEHVKRKMERDDDMILKSQEGGVGVEREDNILEELMEAVHTCVQDLLQTAHSSSKSSAPLIMIYSSPNTANVHLYVYSSMYCTGAYMELRMYWSWYSYIYR